MIGEAFGNYRVTAKLGSGTMGVVYRAEHARIARTAAIKVLIPELAQNASVVQRFFTEARATSLIRHPGIVEVFDCDVDATGRAYIVMEHLDGETLADCLRRMAVIPWATACEIARQVAEAIAAAHDNGIFHRDLKPENVFLVGDPADRHSVDTVGSVKVLDFGIAKLRAADPSARLTMRGMVLGTPEYMAPEQCGGSEETDERADIYALGCILFEMLSGEPPYLAETIQELMVSHMFHPVPSIGERIPGLPAWLAGLVTIMLAKRRDERPASMREVARALGERTKAAPIAPRAATSSWRGRKTAILMGIAGASSLAGAVWIAGHALRRSSPGRAAPVAALPAAPAIARETPLAAPPGMVVPAQAALPIPPVSSAPPPRKRVRAAERPQPPARSAPREAAPTPKQMVDTDGIVDL